MTHVTRILHYLSGRYVYFGHRGPCTSGPSTVCPAAVNLGTASIVEHGFVYHASVSGFLNAVGTGQSLSAVDAVQHAVDSLEARQPQSLEELASVLIERGLVDQAENLRLLPTFGHRSTWVSGLINGGSAVVSWDTRSATQRALVRRVTTPETGDPSAWLEMVVTPTEWRSTHRLCFTSLLPGNAQASQHLEVMLVEAVGGEGGPAYQLVEWATGKDAVWTFSPDDGWQWCGKSMSAVGELDVEVS